jgi:hypothetical protein
LAISAKAPVGSATLSEGSEGVSLTREGVSLTRAVGDFGQSTSRLCHFRLISTLDLISILLRPARPFNALTTVPDRLAQTPISANPLKTLLEHS